MNTNGCLMQTYYHRKFINDRNEQFITQAGKLKLEQELAELEGPRRQEISRRLKSALKWAFFLKMRTTFLRKKTRDFRRPYPGNQSHSQERNGC